MRQSKCLLILTRKEAASQAAVHRWQTSLLLTGGYADCRLGEQQCCLLWSPLTWKVAIDMMTAQSMTPMHSRRVLPMGKAASCLAIVHSATCSTAWQGMQDKGDCSSDAT